MRRLGVRVPASSANLGPGFDALGMALGLYLTVEVAGATGSAGAAGTVAEAAADETHPAVVAFRRLGGRGELVVRGDIPPGRGLGFSGAARVGGLLAAALQQGRSVDEARADVLAVATELERHPDNVAASLHGGIVAASAGRAVRVPLARAPVVVVWVPDVETSTDEARAVLPASVPFADAVFNVGRTALLVAALAAGEVTALRAATEDRLHQDARLAARPGSRAALAAAHDAGAWAAWLSGSGPTVAALAPDVAAAQVLAAAMPGDGRVQVLEVDLAGAVALDG